MFGEERMSIQTDHIHRILFIRLSALGDCVASLPALIALRKRFRHAHIAWAIQDNCMPLIQTLKHIDEIIAFPRQRWKRLSRMRQAAEAWRLVRRLRLRRFDLAVDVQSNLKSGCIGRLSGAPIRLGHGAGQGKERSEWLTTHQVKPDPAQPHVIRRNLALLEPLGIETAEPEFSLPPDPLSVRRHRSWMKRAGLESKQYLLLAPFCSRPGKEWPADRFAELARTLADSGQAPVVMNAPGREDECKTILAAAGPGAIPAPRLSIPDMTEWVRHAGAMLGGDTAPTQIAGALKTPVAVVFGDSDPLRTSPWNMTARLTIDASVSDAASALLEAAGRPLPAS